MADRTVKIRVEALIGQYEAAMAKAGVSTKSLGHTIESFASGSERSFKSMALGLKDVGGGAVAAGAIAATAGMAFVKVAREGIDAYLELTSEVKAYKNVTGASAEESSKMVAVARVLGVNVDTVANGMFRLSRQVGANRDALAADGVVIAKTKDGHVDLTGTLQSVAAAYQQAGAGAAGNTVLFDAFGRSGRSMIPILKQSREQLEEFWAAAQKHGEIISDADLKAAFEYKVAQRENTAATEGFKISLGRSLVPAVTEATRATTDYVDKASGRDGWWESAKAILFGVKVGHDAAADAAHRSASAEQEHIDKLTVEAEKTKEFDQALDGLLVSSFSVSEAQGKFTSDLAAFADKVQAAKLAGDGFATSLDESTTTGRANAEMVRGLTKDIVDTAKAAQATGADVEAATSLQRDALAKVLEQFGFNHAEAKKYADVLVNLDGLVVQSTVDLDITPAERKVQELKNQFNFLNPIPGSGAPSPAVTAALAGEGPEAKAERERLWREAEQRQRDADQRRREAQQAADDRARAARDAQQQRDARERNSFDFGGISADDYKRYLDQRIAVTARYTDEWVGLMNEQKRVNDAIGQAWMAAQEQINASEQRWMDVLRMQHEFGERSTDDYLEQLKKRLAGLAKYSAEWESTMREIQQLEQQTSESELAIMAAVEKQRQFDEAFYGAESQRNLQAERSASVLVQAGSTTTRTYSPTFYVTTADPNTYSANQKMRDDAFLAGV